MLLAVKNETYSSVSLPVHEKTDQLQNHAYFDSQNSKIGEASTTLNVWIRSLLWNIVLLVGTLVYSSYTILVHLCEVEGRIPFNSSCVVLFIELLKITLSITFYCPEVFQRGSFNCPSYFIVLSYTVPALLYSINNNLAVYIQLEMDPVTYQVLGNLKILSTALLFRLIIKRPISLVQWIALGMLTMAGICNSYTGFNVKVSTSDLISSAGTLHITSRGVYMISIYCTISGLAGVYTEYVLKKYSHLSIHLQNALLYIFGINLNGLACAYQSRSCIQTDSNQPCTASNVFEGFSSYTILLIISQAIGGIIMGAIMKYASNITRLFVISCAMLVTTASSIVIFNLHVDVYFCMSVVLVIVALCLYNKD